MASEGVGAALQALRTVHYALVVSPLLFALLVTLQFEALAGDGEGDGLVGTVLLVVALVNTIAAPIVRSRTLGYVRNAVTDDGAMKAYRTATVLFCALLESAALVLLVAALLAGELLPYVPAVLVPMALGLASPPSERHFRGLREGESG